jgi:tripartite-type tricarboxylate transporter receptor subunit TctC
MPEVPTIAEQGVADYDTGGWYGLVAPPGLPADRADLLSTELVKMMKLPELRERFVAESAEPIGSTRAEMATFLAADFKRWSQVVKATETKADGK